MKRKKMIRPIIIILLSTSLIFLILHLFDVIEWHLVLVCFLTAGITLINAFFAYFLFKKSLGKPNKDFLVYNLGGMLVRMFFLLLVVFIVIKFLNVDEYAFIFLFFIFYFTSLIFEVNYFRIKARQ